LVINVINRANANLLAELWHVGGPKLIVSTAPPVCC